MTTAPGTNGKWMTRRLMGYAVADLLGIALIAAGGIPLIDGMPIWSRPATTGEAWAFVVVGAILVVFASAQTVRELIRQVALEA
jgi:type IV secretory pathway VirB2 component (pilin)